MSQERRTAEMMYSRLTKGMFLMVAIAACMATVVPSHASPPLRIGLVTDVNTLDPVNTATVGTDLSVISHLYTPLITRGPDLKLAPGLALSWRSVDDLTWRFKLREGISFPNGEKLDAEAVRWNIEHILDPKTKARIASWYKPISEVRVISPAEIEVKTSKPFPELAATFSSFFLLAPKWTSSHNPAVEAMGTGPYDLVEFVSGDHITLKAKSNYWGSKPDFDTVVFRPVPETASRVAGILSGDLDVVLGIPPSELKQIQGKSNIKAGSVPSTRMLFVKLNTLKEPFKGNPKLRQALNYAVDKQGIADAVLGGLVAPCKCQVLMDGYFGYNPDLKPYPYDPKKAKQLLAEAGFPRGLEVELEVPLGRYLLAGEIGQAVAAMLEQVGVRVKIVEMQFGPFMDKYLKAGDLGQMAYLGQGWPTLDADGLLTLFEPGNKYAYWDDQVFGELLKKARSITDAGKRLELYKQATQRMCQEAPVIFLFNQPTTYAVSSRVDWKARSDDWVRAYDMKKAK
jgi:peptide/nickel transport system substrate-binding protein